MLPGFYAYVLKYLGWAKYICIGVCAFFLLVFISCVHQLCRRGCCGEKKQSINGGWNAGGGNVQFVNANRAQNDMYLSRP